MNFRLLKTFLVSLAFALVAWAQDSGAAAPTAKTADAASTADAAAKANTTAAAAVVTTTKVPPTPDFLEHLVDETLNIFDVKSSGNTWVHFAIAALFLVCGLLLRRVVTAIIFNYLKKLAAKTT